MCAKSAAARPDSLIVNPRDGDLAARARRYGVAGALAASLLLLAVPALGQTLAPRELDLPGAWRQSDVVVVAQVLDRTEVTQLTVRAPNGRPVEPYRRVVRLYQRLDVLRGSAPALLRVDEAQWRARWHAAQRCGGRSDCQEAQRDRYVGQVHREPPPGQRVLLFLRKTQDGLEWTADFAVDKAERAEEVRRLRVRPADKAAGGAQ